MKLSGDGAWNALDDELVGVRRLLGAHSDEQRPGRVLVRPGSADDWNGEAVVGKHGDLAAEDDVPVRQAGDSVDREQLFRQGVILRGSCVEKTDGLRRYLAIENELGRVRVRSGLNLTPLEFGCQNHLQQFGGKIASPSGAARRGVQVGREKS